MASPRENDLCLLLLVLETISFDTSFSSAGVKKQIFKKILKQWFKIFLYSGEKIRFASNFHLNQIISEFKKI